MNNTCLKAVNLSLKSDWLIGMILQKYKCRNAGKTQKTHSWAARQASITGDSITVH